MELLAVWGQLGHQSLEAALLWAQSGLKEDEVEVKQTELSDWHGSCQLQNLPSAVTTELLKHVVSYITAQFNLQLTGRLSFHQD